MRGCRGFFAENFTYIPVKTAAQTPMLLAHPTVNPEVQGSNLAVDIFCFVTNFFTVTRVGDSVQLSIDFLSILDTNTVQGPMQRL